MYEPSQSAAITSLGLQSAWPVPPGSKWAGKGQGCEKCSGKPEHSLPERVRTLYVFALVILYYIAAGGQGWGKLWEMREKQRLLFRK